MVQKQAPLTPRQSVLARRRAERHVAEVMANANFEQLMNWVATDHEYSAAAVNHLFQPVDAVLQRRSTWICSRIGHLGRVSDCQCATCDRAWLSSYHVLVERSFGLPPGNASSARHFPAQPPRPTGKPIESRSALGSRPTTLEEWFAAVRKVTHYTGVETDCLRAWNKDRGLTVRVDQKSYFVDRNGHLTPLALRLEEEWQEVRDSWSLDLVPPQMTTDDLLAFLRAVYSDACQWGYQGELITRRRARRTYVNPDALSPEWSSWFDHSYRISVEAGDRDVYDCLTKFVGALRRACHFTAEGNRLETPLHPVYGTIERAWAATRHEPTGGAMDASVLENLPEPSGND